MGPTLFRVRINQIKSNIIDTKLHASPSFHAWDLICGWRKSCGPRQHLVMQPH
jgi:hypothetical protein